MGESVSHRIRLLTAAGIVAGLVMTAGCSSPRSVQAYCAAMEQHKSLYLSAMNSDPNGKNPVAGLLNAASAIGDLKSMWKDMADAAPEEIRSDTESVRDAWAKQEDAAISGDWKAIIGGAIVNAGPMSRVGAYVGQHCGHPSS